VVELVSLPVPLEQRVVVQKTHNPAGRLEAAAFDFGHAREPDDVAFVQGHFEFHFNLIVVHHLNAVLRPHDHKALVFIKLESLEDFSRVFIVQPDFFGQLDVFVDDVNLVELVVDNGVTLEA